MSGSRQNFDKPFFEHFEVFGSPCKDMYTMYMYIYIYIHIHVHVCMYACMYI